MCDRTELDKIGHTRSDKYGRDIVQTVLTWYPIYKKCRPERVRKRCSDDVLKIGKTWNRVGMEYSLPNSSYSTRKTYS